MTGHNNTVVGFQAARALTSATDSIFMGSSAGVSVTTGANNIMIGRAAGDGFDTESHNLGIGTDALGGGSLAGGEYKVAIGNYSLDALTSGDGNGAVG